MGDNQKKFEKPVEEPIVDKKEKLDKVKYGDQMAWNTYHYEQMSVFPGGSLIKTMRRLWG